MNDTEPHLTGCNESLGQIIHSLGQGSEEPVVYSVAKLFLENVFE